MSADVAAIVALAKRCEKAIGADRDIEWRIAQAIGVGDFRPSALWPPFMIGSKADKEIPRYTASLDAAMTLLNDVGVLLGLSDIGADGLPLARVGCPGLECVPVFVGIASCIMTDTSPVAGLSLALCAAALRARACSLQQGEGRDG